MEMIENGLIRPIFEHPAKERALVTRCAICGKEIYEDDICYQIQDVDYCCDCIEASRVVAW